MVYIESLARIGNGLDKANKLILNPDFRGGIGEEMCYSVCELSACSGMGCILIERAVLHFVFLDPDLYSTGVSNGLGLSSLPRPVPPRLHQLCPFL